MMSINPFATLSETVPSVLLQGFVVVMLGLIFFGTLVAGVIGFFTWDG